MARTCGFHFGDASSLRNSSGARLLHQDPAFEIQPGGEAEVFVGRPGIAINAAVFASAIGIDAGIEADVGTVVIGNDAGGCILRNSVEARDPPPDSIPVTFQLEFLEPVDRFEAAPRPLME